ncbi:TonB-dependent receptor [Bacteroides sp.]|uniref:SusC/RagA family TonB-linked outer membrane protein n=1 Tax=Bacteroides sp. TaxID=29523 RepID=UPI002618441B|nr:TonB-dependent receptor [Bacteroides sp.]
MIKIKMKDKIKRMLLLSLFTSVCCFSGYAKDKKDSSLSINEKNSITSLSQYKKISGIVKDATGEPIIGANVSVKGATTGTITDIDGRFTIDVPENGTLVISFIGYVTLNVELKGKSQLDIVLKEDAMMLDEVVAIGYATVKRKDLTGSIASVKSEELLKIPTSDITQALAGRMAGVQVSQSEGAPGASISIRVRGGISITQSNEPLYVIDGFPTEDGMSTLDPAEIETIDILKDASATAIYGARGANGVVVITTKNGAKNKGKATITFDSYVGVRKLANQLDVLNPYEYVLADYERTVSASDSEEGIAKWQKRYGDFKDIRANYGSRKGINWQEEVLGRTTVAQNYRVGINGGGEKTQYNMAYSYFKDEGAMMYSGNHKHNISLSVNSEISKRLSVTGRISFDQLNIYGVGTSGNGTGEDGSNTEARFNKMTHIIQYRPTIGIEGNDYDLLSGEDPLLADESGNVMQNPLISAREEENNKEYRTFQANGSLTFNIIDGLTFRNTTGMRYQTFRHEMFYGDESIIGKRSSINGSIMNKETGSFQTSNVLTYAKDFNRHSFTAMIGQEFVNRWDRYFKASASNFPNDEIGLGDLSLGIAGIPESSENYDDKLISFFGRINYDFADKYIFTASLRADGSSKFGKNNKWGYFPAVSAAWRLGEEEFIKNLNLFSDLKFRIGYGLAGNNRIGSYNSLAILSSISAIMGDGTVAGYAPSQIPNPDLKWEANKTFNLGMDFGFLNQRLTISPEFYVNKSSNLLLNAILPYSSGYQSMVINAGETKNMGLDLTINSVNIATKDFNWNTTLTLSHNKNTVEALTGEAVQLYEAKFGFNLNTHKLAVGEPLGQFYGYQTEGLYQVSDFNYDADKQAYTLKDGIPYHGDRNSVRPGMWKFKNLTDDEIIDENDKTVIGDVNPDFYGGLNNTFTWKNFDLSVFLTFSYGNEVLNATKLINSKIGNKNYNALNVMNSSNRWMTIGANGQVVTDPTELTALNAGKTLPAYYDAEGGDNYIHSWGVEDASFLKLSNITIGYTFPKSTIRKIGLSNLRLYATGNNLATWTKYTGFDPEVSTMSSSLTPGVDSGAYPRSRSFIFGINVAF